jgi:hypothetical protein
MLLHKGSLNNENSYLNGQNNNYNNSYSTSMNPSSNNNYNRQQFLHMNMKLPNSAKDLAA